MKTTLIVSIIALTGTILASWFFPGFAVWVSSSNKPAVTNSQPKSLASSSEANSALHEEIARLTAKVQDLEASLQSSSKSQKTSLEKQPQLETPASTLQTSSALSSAVWKPDGSHLDDPFVGKETNEVIVLAFIDYLSSSSRTFFANSFENLRNHYLKSHKIKFIVRDYPLDDNESSILAAKSALCAGEQGLYNEMSQHLLAWNTDDPGSSLGEYIRLVPIPEQDRFESCLTSKQYPSEASKDKLEAQQLGVKGAPSFFLGKIQEDGSYKGFFLRGAQPYKVFANLIERLLK